MKEIKVTNIRELTNDLLNVYNAVRNKEMTQSDAIAISKISSRIVSAANSEKAYYNYLGERVEVPFLDMRKK